MRPKRKPKPAPRPTQVTVDDHRAGPHGLERYEEILPAPKKRP